jgi:beta-glucosidase
MGIVSCTHYDWGTHASGLEGSTDEVDTGENMETVVAYGERPPITKAAVCEDASYTLPFTAPYVPSDAIRSQVNNELASLSIDEKVEQMTGTDCDNGNNKADIFRQRDNTIKMIRGFKFRDGPRGLNLDAELQPGYNGFSTAFPVSMARGATFDLNLEYRIGLAQGEETLASFHTLLLAPTVNLLRHPAWGRAQETYGEDPYLLGRMGTAYTVGVQQYIPACVKHYAANNVENGRASSDSTMDDQTLREIYGRAFEMIIRDGGVACVMAAYNLLNNTHCTENAHLLTEVLRNDFGFEGFVMSDWWAMTNGADAGKLPGEYQSAAANGVSAGMDMELPWALNYREIPGLIENQQISEADVNHSVSRILEQKYRFNVGDLNSTTYGLKTPEVGWDRNTGSIVDTNDQHLNLAVEAALKSAVLLKNDNNTLPIKRESVTNIAVLGATVNYDIIGFSGTVNYAVDTITGDLGSSRVRWDPNRAVGPLAGIKEAAGSAVTVTSGSSAADAANADFVVVVAGLNAEDEGEEYTGAGDRSSFALDAKSDAKPQNELIAAVAALGKPMVVVLEGGSVIDMPWLASVPAVLMSWYSGMAGGRAIGKLLFGDESPSGKLPLTWPVSWDDEPVFNPGTTVDMGYFAGYRYFAQQNKTPLFPFGYGLSYSTFQYLNLEVPCTSATNDSVMMVKVDVSNQGAVKADEVVFLFTAYPDSTDERKRIKQLKGFYRVSLNAGETKQVTIPLRINDLRFYDQASQSWGFESGELEISIGKDAMNTLTSPSNKVLSDRITIVAN